MRPSGIYHCRCKTCDYEVELFDKRKAVQARNYHKYRNRSHDVTVEQVGGTVQAAKMQDLHAMTHGRNYEFEENYRWWMWFYRFL